MAELPVIVRKRVLGVRTWRTQAVSEALARLRSAREVIGRRLNRYWDIEAACPVCRAAREDVCRPHAPKRPDAGFRVHHRTQEAPTCWRCTRKSRVTITTGTGWVVTHWCPSCAVAEGVIPPGCTCERAVRIQRALYVGWSKIQEMELRAMAAHRERLRLQPLSVLTEDHPNPWGAPSGEAQAHASPLEHHHAGLHAVSVEAPRWVAESWGIERLGTLPVGIVSLWGVVVEHADGVLRASHARIEVIVTPEEPTARALREHYRGIPVVCARPDYVIALAERAREVMI